MHSDGYILVVHNYFSLSILEVNYTDSISFFVSHPSLDGRCVLSALPRCYTLSNFVNAFNISLETLSQTLAAELTRLVVGELRAILYHPYSVDEAFLLF